jgi:uncharacterized protein (DUF1697 family)
MARTFVALLRGINVGTAKRISMAGLKELVQSLGYADVRTLLNSGNVVFSASRGTPAQAGTRIEKAIADRLGLAVPVTCLDAGELEEVLAANPFASIADNPSRLLVAILADARDVPKIAAVEAADWGVEKMARGPGRAVYLWIPSGVIESRLNAAFSKALGTAVTARNWATIQKLGAMVSG